MFMIKIVPIEFNKSEVPCKFSNFVYSAKNFSIHKQVKYPHDPEKEIHDKHSGRSCVYLENDYFGQREKFEMYEIFQIGMDTVDGYRIVHAPFSDIYILNHEGKTIDSYKGSLALKK